MLACFGSLWSLHGCLSAVKLDYVYATVVPLLVATLNRGLIREGLLYMYVPLPLCCLSVVNPAMTCADKGQNRSPNFISMLFMCIYKNSISSCPQVTWRELLPSGNSRRTPLFWSDSSMSRQLSITAANCCCRCGWPGDSINDTTSTNRWEQRAKVRITLLLGHPIRKWDPHRVSNFFFFNIFRRRFWGHAWGR